MRWQGDAACSTAGGLRDARRPRAGVVARRRQGDAACGTAGCRRGAGRPWRREEAARRREGDAAALQAVVEARASVVGSKVAWPHVGGKATWPAALRAVVSWREACNAAACARQGASSWRDGRRVAGGCVTSTAEASRRRWGRRRAAGSDSSMLPVAPSRGLVVSTAGGVDVARPRPSVRTSEEARGGEAGDCRLMAIVRRGRYYSNRGAVGSRNLRRFRHYLLQHCQMP
ncbi:hypothetical protein ACP70R_043993 [Stipagrostis hirtigluma subsp. patula]